MLWLILYFLYYIGLTIKRNHASMRFV
jgi:hypothetical protein